MGPQIWYGLRDTLNVLIEVSDKKIRTLSINLKPDFEKIATSTFGTLQQLRECLLQLESNFQIIQNGFTGEPGSREYRWAATLGLQIQKAITEVQLFAPWLTLPPVPAKFRSLQTLKYIPDMQELLRYCVDAEEEILLITIRPKYDRRK